MNHCLFSIVLQEAWRDFEDEKPPFVHFVSINASFKKFPARLSGRKTVVSQSYFWLIGSSSAVRISYRPETVIRGVDLRSIEDTAVIELLLTRPERKVER